MSFSIDVRLCCRLFDDVPNTVARLLSGSVDPGNVHCMLKPQLLEETLYISRLGSGRPME